MARRPRLEFEGAIYHVFNRVNPGRDVFGVAAAARLFEECLFEACRDFGWKLHAYCIVHEGFHIALETPRANLVTGMHWFQSTFAKRLRASDGINGSLFQGRYRALSVEPGAPLENLVAYIHVRPAIAGVVEPGMLPLFRWSSLRRILKSDCPDFLTAESSLDGFKQLEGAPNPRAAMKEHLVGLARDPERKMAIGMRGMTRGPVIGSKAFREAIPAMNAEAPGEPEWREAIERLMGECGKTCEDLAGDAKGASWKIEIAMALRGCLGAPLEWIAGELEMGTVNSLSHYLWLARKAAKAETAS